MCAGPGICACKARARLPLCRIALVAEPSTPALSRGMHIASQGRPATESTRQDQELSGNPMINTYQRYQQDAGTTDALSVWARMTGPLQGRELHGWPAHPALRRMASAGEVVARTQLTHAPPFDLGAVEEGGRTIAVHEDVIGQTPFCTLPRFRKATSPSQPLTLTLMAGPIDRRINPPAVNELASSRPIEWFERNLISAVPTPGVGSTPVGAIGGFMNLKLSGTWMPFAISTSARSRASWRWRTGSRPFYEGYFAMTDCRVLPGDRAQRIPGARLTARAPAIPGPICEPGRHPAHPFIYPRAKKAIFAHRPDAGCTGTVQRHPAGTTPAPCSDCRRPSWRLQWSPLGK